MSPTSSQVLGPILSQAPSPIPDSNQSPNLPNLPVPASETPVFEPGKNLETAPEKTMELLVYSRKHKTQTEAEDCPLSKQCQEPIPSSQSAEIHTGNASYDFKTSDLPNDLDMPIALREGGCVLNIQSVILSLLRGYLPATRPLPQL